MDGKKLSFGFNKLAKKPNLIPLQKTKKASNSVELIKCLEGQEIKLVEEKQEKAPLVIPMKQNEQTSSALASIMRRRAVLMGEETEEAEIIVDARSNDIENTENNQTNESLESRAVLELLSEARADTENAATIDSKLVLPILTADELPLDGAAQSTREDYEAIPIQQFGMAMLRGMGWVEPVKKKSALNAAEDMPFVRPKGMGLGADKALKSKPLLVQPEPNEVLEIKKQACVRILAGKYKDLYGQIEGFDDHAGRVIVKMAIGGSKEAFNEFLCQPVPKKEYAQYAKCLNTAKYEEYKKLENEHGQIVFKTDSAGEKINHKSSLKMKMEPDEKQSKLQYKELRDEYKIDIKKEKREYPADDKIETTSKIQFGYNRDIKNKSPSKSAEGRYESDRIRQNYKRESNSEERYREKTKRTEKKNNTNYNDEHRESAKHVDSKDYNRSDKRNEVYNRNYSRDYRDNRTYDMQCRQSIEQSRHSRKSRSTERRNTQKPISSRSSSHRKRHKSSLEQSTDTSASSSDSDSAYERKYEKSSQAKKKKTKKAKNKSRRHTTSSSAESDCEEKTRRHKKQNKKKSKKSKKQRSRTRSRSRIDKR